MGRYVRVKAATVRYLMVRGETYLYKRRVPAKFQSVIGRTAWWITIRAASLPEAQIKAIRLAEEHDAQLARLSRLSPSEVARHAVRKAGSDRTRLVKALKDALPHLPPSVQTAIEAEGGVTGLLDTIKLHAVDRAVVDLSGPEGVAALTLPPNAASMSPARLRAEVSELAEWQDIHRRAREDANRLGPLTRAIGVAGPDVTPTVSEAAEEWLRRKPRQPNTVNRIRLVVRRLAEHAGDIPITEFTSRMLVKFMDDVARLPDTAGLPDKVRTSAMPALVAWATTHPDHPAVMPSTVNQYLSVVKALFAWAARRELVPSDPTTKLERAHDARGQSEKRQPFAREQLGKLVEASRRLWGEEDRLILLASVYSGLRISEVGGLERTDLRQDPDASGWFLALRHNRHRRLKVRDSERVVPVHPDVASALVAYAEKVPGDGLLFPSMGPNVAYGVAGLSKRFGRLMSGAGISDHRLTWHSIRHSWETHAKDRIPDPGRRYLVGRKETGSARSYDHGPGLAQVVEWVAMLDPLGRKDTSGAA